MERWFSTAQDTAGNGLPGVSVRVNIASTTTLASLFSDNGVTPLANPFTNNANGTFEFYAANGRYDVILTRTGYVFPADETADLLLQDSTTFPFINLLNYGTTRAAMQAAIDAAPLTGANIWIPYGTYTWDSTTITVDRPVVIQGGGNTGTTITSAAATVFNVTLSAAQAPVTFKDFRLNLATNATGIALDFGTEVGGSQLTGLYISDGACAIKTVKNALNNAITNGFFIDQTGNALWLTNTVDTDRGDSVIANCQIEGSGVGLRLDVCGARVIGNKFIGGQTTSLYATVLAGLQVSGNDFSAFTSSGIEFLAIGGDVTIVGNFIAGATTCLKLIGSVGTTSDIARMTINGNVIRPTTAPTIGIDVRNLELTSIVGNQWHGGSTFITMTNCENSTVMIGNNQWVASSAPYILTVGAVLNDYMGIAFADLPAVVADGSYVWCGNCTFNGGANTNNACAGGGNGTFATFISGAWRCA